MVGYIERSLHYRKYTLAVFLDIEWPFKNIGIEVTRVALEGMENLHVKVVELSVQT